MIVVMDRAKANFQRGVSTVYLDAGCCAPLTCAPAVTCTSSDHFAPCYGSLTGARAELPDLMPVGRGASAARDCPQRAVRNVQIKGTCLLGVYNTEEKQCNQDGTMGTTQDLVLHRTWQLCTEL